MSLQLVHKPIVFHTKGLILINDRTLLRVNCELCNEHLIDFIKKIIFYSSYVAYLRTLYSMFNCRVQIEITEVINKKHHNNTITTDLKTQCGRFSNYRKRNSIIVKY